LADAPLTNDALILATALRIGATLVTGNAGDFALLRQHLTGVVVDVHVPP
jgi:predicted nucleic acid-binding protein